MGIYIKGMEMPTRCFSCQMCDVENEEVNCEISHGYYIECRKVDPKIAIQERPSWCPLVEVPEDVQPVKHGEWVDEGFYADGSAKHAFHCSNCGHHIIEWKDDTSNYCPHCGARMDGET